MTGRATDRDVNESLHHLVDRLSADLGLTIPDESRQVLMGHLEISLHMAAKVMAAPLPYPTIENAPVFSPQGRDVGTT